MKKILLITNTEPMPQEKKLVAVLNESGIKTELCTEPEQLKTSIENFSPNIIILNPAVDGAVYECKKIKPFLEKEFIFLIVAVTDENFNCNEIKHAQAFVKYRNDDDLNCMLGNINSLFETQKNIHNLSNDNTDLQKSLYQIDSLYHTSFQFAGTLDKHKLVDIMVEGLEKSLSYNISCVFIVESNNQASLIIKSLYPVSQRLENALKLRSFLTYKSLCDSGNISDNIPFENIKAEIIVQHRFAEYDLNIFKFDNLFSPITIGERFFGFINVFKETDFSSEDATCFQTLTKQVSIPLETALLYEEITNTNLKLERLERLKSEFISIVSHELRTPLTAIKNSLDILLSGVTGQLSENAQKFLNTAKRNVLRLATIINDLLDLSKIEAGKMQLHFEKINIIPTVEFMKNTFSAQAKEKNIELISDISVDNPNIFIYADQIKIEQILSNLISNAIKFTPAGGKVSICASCTIVNEIKNIKFNNHINETKNYLLVSVKDTGIGIKEEDKEKVFDEFQQIENSNTRKIGGTGLGLPIAKQLTEKHFGTIWFESEINKGTSFYVAIPLYNERTAFRLDCESLFQESQIHKKTLAMIKLKETNQSEYSIIDEIVKDVTIITSAVNVRYFVEQENEEKLITLVIPEADKFVTDFIIKKLNAMLQNRQSSKVCDILYSKVVFPDDEPDNTKIWNMLSENYKKLG